MDRLRYFPLSCLAALLVVLPITGFPIAAAQAQQTQIVKLVIRYGDGVEKHFTAIEWRDGMTVLDVMKGAHEHPRGIEFEFAGEGEKAFLSSIDEISNEGEGRNWLYRVNGEKGDRSFAVKSIAAGDVVDWTFGPLGEQ